MVASILLFCGVLHLPYKEMDKDDFATNLLETKFKQIFLVQSPSSFPARSMYYINRLFIYLCIYCIVWTLISYLIMLLKLMKLQYPKSRGRNYRITYSILQDITSVTVNKTLSTHKDHSSYLKKPCRTYHRQYLSYIYYIYLLLTLIKVPTAEAETAVMHYGHFGGLSISCRPGELILMQSQRLGFSNDASCKPKARCSVPYDLAKWYCRGRSTCGGMQVERRPLHKRTCGSDFTNCLRVEYQCIPVKSLTDICKDTIVENPVGYIRSPAFPEMYPANQNCTCSIEATPGNRVQLLSSFFLLKSSTPCDDWVEISVNEEKIKRCGYLPEQRPYVGQQILLNFHTDASHTEMGFWYHYQGSNGSPVTLRCGRYALSQETESPLVTESGKQGIVSEPPLDEKSDEEQSHFNRMTMKVSSTESPHTLGHDIDEVTETENTTAGISDFAKTSISTTVHNLNETHIYPTRKKKKVPTATLR